MNRSKLDNYIKDITENIELINERVEKVSAEQFHSDTVLLDSVVYRLAVIGEAVNKLAPEFTSKFPEIDWRAIVSMRNILVHEYAYVDANIVWETIKTDLPKLLSALRASN